MTDLIDLGVDTVDEHLEASNGQTSVRDRVRAKAKKLEAGKVRLPLDVPGYDGDLVAFFRKVPYAELKVISEGMERERNREGNTAELDAACDVLLRTVLDVNYRDPNSPTGYTPVTDTGDPCGLGTDLTEAIGLGTYPDGRSAIKHVMGKGGDAGIIGMFEQVMNWSRFGKADVREQLVGESSATRT